MKDYSNILIVYPKDPSIEFLEPIRKTLEGLFPEAKLFQPEPGNHGNAVEDETDLVIFFGHGTSSRLCGSIDDKGEKSLYLNVSTGSVVLDKVAVVLFACNSSDYLKNVQAEAEIDCYLTFGDMPTDWEHIMHNRATNPNFLLDFKDEHLEYYKSTIVESMVEGFKYGFKTNSFLGIPRRICLIINRKINEVLLGKKWKKSQKHQMIQLLVDFKQEINYSQPL